MSNREQQKVPEGFMQNAQGHLVPVSKVREIDKMRDALVGGLMGEAKERAAEMAAFKARCYSDIEAFIETAAKQYKLKLGGKKGNVTLTSYDGRFKIIRAIDESIVFTEGLQIAKSLIDNCIRRWSTGSNANLCVIASKAFQSDKQGNLSTARVLSLAAIKFDDAEWKRAVEAIHQAVRVSATKTYLRFYERDDRGCYMQIALDGGN